MDIEYSDERLATIESDEPLKSGLPVPVINSARRKIQFMRSAKDERDLWEWRSLNYEKLVGNRKGTSSIRLNDRWRMILTVDTNSNPNVVTIFEIVDYHN